jgi:hypothetical protein
MPVFTDAFGEACLALFEPHAKTALAPGAIVLQQQRSAYVHRSKLARGKFSTNSF